MVGIAATLMKVAINIAAGIGVANVFDNWVKPKVPQQYYPDRIGTGLNVWKILWLSVAFVASFMLLNWVGKATGLKILKRKI